MKTTVLDSLNAGLLSAMEKDPNVILLGEDILDPYGGAFKVTRGCSSAYPDRVLAAPISEAGLAGVTAGLSLRGLRPVLEIMFGDFTTLIADQLINHIAKFRWMYNNTVNLPLVIRTPMGGRRGYGPTHSQTLEKLFLGVPGLKVWTPTHFCDHKGELTPGNLLEKAILQSDDPVLFIENKLQYLIPLIYAEEQTDLDVQVVPDESGSYTIKIGLSGAPPPSVTLAGYGYMAELARQAMVKLAYEEEIFCELIVYTELSPFDIHPLETSLARTGRLVTLEEGGLTLGWGAEILARVTESGRDPGIRAARVSALDLPVAAASALEQVILPQVEDILTAVRKVAFVMKADLIPVLVPLVNPNETESVLVSLKVKEGQFATKGDVLAEFETTKSTHELMAESDGYLVGLKFHGGELIKAGVVLGYLAASPDFTPPAADHQISERTNTEKAIPKNLRITQPALALAKARIVDLDSLPRDVLITEEYIRSLSQKELPQPDPTHLVIYGGGGHAKSLIDLIHAERKYLIDGVLDDHLPVGQRVLDVEVIGGGDLLPGLRAKGIGLAVNAVGGIGTIAPRLAVYQKLAEAGFSVVTVIHPLAHIEPTAKVAEGCQLFYHAYVGSDVKVGFGCIINTGAIISHDCDLGQYANISPGAILAGAVSVGERALIGMGATVNLGVKIGAGARIGNSAVVKADVPENGIVRAGTIWPPVA